MDINDWFTPRRGEYLDSVAQVGTVYYGGQGYAPDQVEAFAAQLALLAGTARKHAAPNARVVPGEAQSLSSHLSVEQLVTLVAPGDEWDVIHRLSDRIEQQNKAQLPQIIEVACTEAKELAEAIAENGAPVAFVWGVTRYDNGWFFTGTAVTVTFANGEAEEVEVDFDEILTAIRNDIGGDEVNSSSSLTYDVATKAYALT